MNLSPSQYRRYTGFLADIMDEMDILWASRANRFRSRLISIPDLFYSFLVAFNESIEVLSWNRIHKFGEFDAYFGP